MEDTTRTEAFLGDDESFSALSQEIVSRHTHVTEPDLTMITARVTHGRDDPHDFVARSVCRHQDRRKSEMTRRFGLGLTKDCGESGNIRASREPFVAIDHPIIAIEDGCR